MPTAPSPSLTTLTPDQLVQRLRWRYATKRFEPSYRIDPATWLALEQSLVLAPSSFGLQPWHFVVVTDAAVKRELQAVSRNQAQVGDCSHLVVFAIQKDLGPEHVRRFVARTAEVRGVPRESLARFEEVLMGHTRRPAPFSMDDWSARQLYIALGTFLTSAALLGVDACPMEGLEPARYDAILGLEERGLATVCVAAAGRRASDDKYASLPKVRFDARDVITHVG